MSDNTPMMKQYLSIKEQHKDAVLFFRMGDFYEMFKSDAVEVSRLLNLTLTKRNGISMCGLPYHAAENYIGRLLKAGKKIAICEQTALPEKGKGIAKREVVEIITPGTVLDEDYLDKKSNNFLAALGKIKNFYCFSYIDLSTAEFYVTQFSEDFIVDNIRKELYRVSPRELLVQESILEQKDFQFLYQGDYFLNEIEDWKFDQRSASSLLSRHFSTVNLKGFGLDEGRISLTASAVLLAYIEETAKNVLPHIRSLKDYSDRDYLSLDEATQKNLELVKNLQRGDSSFTLLEVLDETMTSMGGRMIRSWILHPLFNLDDILNRQSKVDCLYKDQQNLIELRSLLRQIYDIERLGARVAMDKAHAKDLLLIKNSLYQYRDILLLLENIPNLISETSGRMFDSASLMLLQKELDPIRDLLDKAIKEDPSILLHEGRMIREGYNSELDQLKSMKDNSSELLDKYLDEEKENSGIPNLKIKYNKIIGHFIEVSKGHIDKVPSHFIRRQSLVNNERFTTDRLSEIEVGLNNASDKIIELERKLFITVRESIKDKLAELQAVGVFLAELDSYQSLAYTATVRGYVKPELNNEGSIDILMGRHPVVEAHLPPGNFVPNNSSFDDDQRLFSLITGPNMAGKSTFLRQTALLVLMSQIGSFIPAQQAIIGIVDKIFCRVGATDNLARGESTFLVEMNETANILHNATDRSLVIMDEVGRGTSTEDGLSIAWAISEYLMDHIGVKTLFATHYHELTDLQSPRLINLSLAVREEGDQISFLKRVVEEPANNSYGIHVASLAGIPNEVIERAGDLLKALEKRNSSKAKEDLNNVTVEKGIEGSQFSLFSNEDWLLSEVKNLDINNMTPFDALCVLKSFKDRSAE